MFVPKNSETRAEGGFKGCLDFFLKSIHYGEYLRPQLEKSRCLCGPNFGHLGKPRKTVNGLLPLRGGKYSPTPLIFLGNFLSAE